MITHESILTMLDPNYLKYFLWQFFPMMLRPVVHVSQEEDSEISEENIMNHKTTDHALSDEDYEDDDEAHQDGWGAKKQTYYSRDTADLELGQDVADAEEEEDAAREIYQQKKSRMKESDFYDEFGDVVEVYTADNKLLRKKKGNDNRGGAFSERLESISLRRLGPSAAIVAESEELEKDISHLSFEQKKRLLESHSPELLDLAAELRERVTELRERLAPLAALLDSTAQRQIVSNELLEYLRVKQEAILCYCLNVAFYLHLKTLGESVRDHPVMKQLLKLRFVLERMRPLDSKLQPQLDRLLKLRDVNEGDQQIRSDKDSAQVLRPNPSAILSRDEFDNDEDDREGERHNGVKDSNLAGLYRPPKMSAVPYADYESRSAKQAKQLEQKKRRLKNSELVQALQEEFGLGPEKQGTGGGAGGGDDTLAAQKLLEEREEERRAFEEDRFVRTTLSRVEKKELRKKGRLATRLDNFEDIGDLADLDGLMKMTRKADSVDAADDEDADQPTRSKDAGKAMRWSLDGMASGGKKRKIVDEVREVGNDEFDSLLGMASKEERMLDDEVDILSAFARTKKEFLAKKKAHYTPGPRFGGMEDNVEAGARRPASYEIIKNKGLTPHRKKENRNPRVKKKMQYHDKLVSQSGQVRKVKVGVVGTYKGEETGIKANLSRSRKIV